MKINSLSISIKYFFDNFPIDVLIGNIKPLNEKEEKALFYLDSFVETNAVFDRLIRYEIYFESFYPAKETGITEFKLIDEKTLSENYSFEHENIIYEKENTYFLAFVDDMKSKSSNIDSKDMKWINIKEAESFFEFDSLIEIVREIKYKI